MRSYRLLSVALLGLAAMVPEAKAVVLPPTGVAQNFGALIVAPGLTKVATLTTAFSESSGTATLTGRLLTTVYKLNQTVTEGGIQYLKGDLVFAYRVSVTKPLGTSANLLNFVINGFTNFSGPYDAELTNPPGSGPQSAAYSSAAKTITVNFATPLAAGLSDTMMLIFTKTMFYKGSTASVSGSGGTGLSGIATFTPFTAAPEPGTIALACAALPVLGLYQLRRRRRTQNA
jgi:hypothetical protein